MGWLQKLLLLLCLPLSSSFYFAGAGGSSIAAPSFHGQNQRLQVDLPAPSLPSALPVARQPLLHLKPPSCLPLSPPSFDSQQFDTQLQRYSRFVAKFGKPDILIVGSSRALQGIDPIVLQQTLANRGYPTLKIFNFGVNGATAQVVDLLVRQVLSPDEIPRLLVWGDGVRAFNSGRVDRTYNRAIASQSYQLLTAGIRPMPSTESSQIELHCAVASLKLFDRTTSTKSFDFVRDFDPALNQQQRSGQPLNLLSQPESPAALEQQAVAKLQETGFQPLAKQFKPEAYFQRHPKVQGEYDADYRDFDLRGSQTEALRHVMGFAKVQQISVVFVNLPLTQIYLDEARTLREKQFRAYLQRFSRSHALTVYDLSDQWLNQYAYFTDPSHLNRYGAAAVAAELGKTLVVPKRLPQTRP